jgi:hypothetical protein
MFPERIGGVLRLRRDRGLPAKTKLRARIGVRAERQSATIIPMSTVSHIATEFAIVSMSRESAQHDANEWDTKKNT